MKKLIIIIGFLVMIISCRKEDLDTIKRPGPWVRYSLNTLADTNTEKVSNSFTVWLLSSAGLKDYKIWLDDSLVIEWKVDGPDRDQRTSDFEVDVLFTPDLPETKRILIWASDRADMETQDSLLVKYKGGDPDRGKILYNPSLSYGNIAVQGDDYKTIRIGLMDWFARNLEVVPLTGRYKSAFDSSLFGINLDHVYGYLYSWDAANSINSIPGYHLPGKQQWQHLINEAGGEFGGGALKEKGYNHWWLPNQAASNSTGFTAIPGGQDMEFNPTILSRGYYWTSTEQGNDSAWAVMLSTETAKIEFKVLLKSWLASVRMGQTENHNVQQLLNSGIRPITIISYGYPVDSLYGQTYQGGFIFSYNSWNGGGFVAAPVDQATSAVWTSSNSITGANQTAMYTGINNNYKIFNLPGSAAGLCYSTLINGYQDWFLPSRDELMTMYTNLKLKGYGNFPTFWCSYWTSTEFAGSPANFAEAIHFGTGEVTAVSKNSLNYVRAVRVYN